MVSLYKVFCVGLYVLKIGCQWCTLSKEYPKWQTVHEYHLQWNKKKNCEELSLLK